MNAKIAEKRILHDLGESLLKLPPYCRAGPVGYDIFVWEGTITGPPYTPYEDGTFILRVIFSSDYPFKPPEVSFITPVYHPNISSNGKIYLDMLGDKWSPAYSISDVMIGICVLLERPNLERNVVKQELATLYSNNRFQYNKNARECTRGHAS